MKRKYMVLLILIMLSLQLQAISVDQILQGFARTLMIPNITGTLQVKMISQNGDVREIEADAYQKLVDDSQMNRLFIFKFPPTVRDTGLLVESFYDGRENNMWIYLPAVRRIKRIALESSGGGYFMGSDFTYQDLISSGFGNYNYTIVDENAVVDGIPCYKVVQEGKTREGKQEFGYDKVFNYYRKDDFFMIKREYYDLTGELLKIYQVFDFISFDGYVYPTDISMTNVQTNHRSEIHADGINFDSIPERYFTTRYLQRR